MLFDRVLVATDFSERSEAAMATARHAAKLFDAKEVRLVHVLDTGLGGAALPYGPLQSEAEEAIVAAEANALKKLDSIDLDLGQVTVSTEIRRGSPAYELAFAAEEFEADLIVMATQGRGAIGRAVLGSVTSGVLGYATCPVLVTGRGRATMGAGKEILVAVDLSPVSTGVIRTAARLAAHTGAHLRIHSVYQAPFIVPGEHPMYFGAAARTFEIQARDEHLTLLNRLCREVIPDVDAKVTVEASREAFSAILRLEHAMQPDLTVIGSSGIRTWGRRVFGTNAERIVASTLGPILVVPDLLRRELEPEIPTATQRPTKRHPHEQLVYATFESEPDVREALTKLATASVNMDDISVLTTDETLQSPQDPQAHEKAFAAGGAIGASVGGVLGGLAAMGAATGLGVLVVGPALAMGLAGGLMSALLGFGTPRHEVHRLAYALREGRTIIAVHTHTHDDIQRAKEVFGGMGVSPKRLPL